MGAYHYPIEAWLNMIDLFEKYLGKKLTKKQRDLLMEFDKFTVHGERIFATPKRIAFIHEDVGHLTGGRYYALFLASALCELGHDVTIYTNKMPVFMGEFKGYKRPRIVLAAMNTRRLQLLDIQADVYIGSPISGAIASTKLGVKYNKPSFVLIFDPFPMMEKFLGKRMYVGWDELINNLRTGNTKVISLCKSTSGYIMPWLNKKPDQIAHVYPCINSHVLDSKERDYTKEDYVVFVSRMVRHKHFEDVVSAVSKTKMRLKVISSISGMNYMQYVNQFGMRDRTDFLWKIDDNQKFDVIAKSRGVIVASVFEGFGMFVAEAIACGVPFIGYDYPTFREIRDFAKADNIYLAQTKNPFDLGRKLQQALREKKFNKPSNVFHYEQMIEKLKNI
jgi:glycosyltransferase involved in cell wall biosynthesis